MKVGYWVAIGLIVIAVVAVLAVLWSEREPVEATGDVWVVLAASDGAGHGLADPDDSAWPALLARSLPAPRPRVVNLSVSGLTLDRAIEEILPRARGLRPKRVAIWLAVNDFGIGRPLDAYAADLDRLLGTLREGGAEVVVGNLPDLSTLPFLADLSGDPDELRAECAEWNAAIAAIVARHDGVVVDFFAEPIAPESIGPDGFHPSQEGQRRLAERFRDALIR